MTFINSPRPQFPPARLAFVATDKSLYDFTPGSRVVEVQLAEAAQQAPHVVGAAKGIAFVAARPQLVNLEDFGGRQPVQRLLYFLRRPGHSASYPWHSVEDAGMSLEKQSQVQAHYVLDHFLDKPPNLLPQLRHAHSVPRPAARPGFLFGAAWQFPAGRHSLSQLR